MAAEGLTPKVDHARKRDSAHQSMKNNFEVNYCLRTMKKDTVVQELIK